MSIAGVVEWYTRTTQNRVAQALWVQVPPPAHFFFSYDKIKPMSDDPLYNHSVFLIEVDKIRPNPYQPRQEFNEDRLRDLADSIRQYGVLQPLVVTRKDIVKEDGGLGVEYELIAGERRLRASKIAGLYQVPAVIRTGDQTDKMKLEMAIIENLQREDLNPVDRAQAFSQLATEFNLKHIEIGKRVGKSREYVSNTIRILMLPQEVLDAIVEGKISEGHTRPILMLADRPEEQMTLFREVVAKRLTVRDTEAIARRVAYDKVRHKDTFVKPEIIEMEERLTEKYGTRIKVEKRNGEGGRITIDFFSPDDLQKIMDMMYQGAQLPAGDYEGAMAAAVNDEPTSDSRGEAIREGDEEAGEDDELYSVKNFSL